MRRHVKQLLLAVTIALGGSAIAADLPDYLPNETLFAFGIEGLNQHEAKAQPYIDEWERLDLTALLEAAFAEDAGDEMPEVPDIGAGLLDFVGREAWLTVSASQFNPLPAVTFMAYVTPDGMNASRSLFADLEAEGEVTQMTEGGVTFSVYMPSDEDEFPTPVAYAAFDDVVLVSSNPDVARGVLRRFQGAGEPSLATNSGYLGTVGTQRPGNTYTYLDLGSAVSLATPFAAGMGMESLIARVTAAARTSGVYGTVTRIQDDGLATQSVRVLGGRDGDPALYDLLAGGGPVSDGVLAFTPAAAVGVAASTLDLPGWWSWLESVIASEPQIGITDLDQIVADTVGLDLQGTLFGWMGGEAGTITLGFGDAAAMPTQLTNPLGETVYLVAATDEAAAAAGIAELLTTVTGFATMFMDPMGEGGMVQPVQRDVGGVAVTDWQVAEGFTLSTAATGGYALFATTPEAMNAVLGARAGGAGLSAQLAPLRSGVPSNATSFTLSDDRAALAYSAETLVDQFGMMSGMAGGDIDFDAVEAATGALGEFLAFVTDRLGGSVGYSFVDGPVIRSEGFSSVTW